MEHSPARSLPPATLVGLRARFAGRMPLTVVRRLDTVDDSGLVFEPVVEPAAGASLQTEDANGASHPGGSAGRRSGSR